MKYPLTLSSTKTTFNNLLCTLNNEFDKVAESTVPRTAPTSLLPYQNAQTE